MQTTAGITKRPCIDNSSTKVCKVRKRNCFRRVKIQTTKSSNNQTVTKCKNKVYPNPDANGNSRTFGVTTNSTTVMHFHCHRNFHHVRGDLIHHCQPNGSWSGIDPVCEVDNYMGRISICTGIVSSVVLFFAILLFIDCYQANSKVKKQHERLVEKEISNKEHSLHNVSRINSFRKIPSEILSRGLQIQQDETFDIDMVSRCREATPTISSATSPMSADSIDNLLFSLNEAIIEKRQSQMGNVGGEQHEVINVHKTTSVRSLNRQ